MANGDKFIGNTVASGEVTATGQPIPIQIGFKPSEISVYNINDDVSIVWVPALPNDAGFKYGSGTISPQTFAATGGMFIPMPYDDILGAQGDPNETVDGPEAVNASYIAGYTTVAAGAWAVGAIAAQPDVTRGILISVKNDSGGPLNLFQGNMTWTINGTDELGNAITATAIINSNVGNKTIANGQFRCTASSTCMKTVTSVTLNNVPDNGLKISVGLGSSFKILNGLKTPSSSDVIRVSLNGVNQVSPTDYFVNVVGVQQPSITYKNNIANGDDIQVVYRTLSGTTGDISQATSSDQQYITVGGISPTTSGFVIGTDTDINAAGNTLKWIAYR